MSVPDRRGLSPALFYLAIISCFLVAPPATARIDEEIFVYGQATRNPTTTTPEDARHMLSRIPGGTDVVASEAFENRYATGLHDMLRAVPGVYARQRFAEDVRLSVRGSGLSRGFHMRGLTLTLDGMPLNAADGSGDFQEIDPLLIRHMEVYRGGNGLRYGAASLGGAINIVSPTAHTVDYRTRIRAEGGSFDTLRAQGSFAWRGERADAHGALTGVTSDGFRDQSRQRTLRASLNAGLRFGSGGESRLYVWGNRINQELPGTLSLDDALGNPRIAAPVNIANAYARDIRSLRVANRTVLPVAGGLLEFGSWGTLKDLDHPIFQVIDQKSREAGLFGRWSGNAGPIDTTLGVNLGWGETDARRFVNVGGNPGALTADAEQESLNLTVYGEARAELTPALTAVLGGQIIHAHRHYDDHLNVLMSDRGSFTSASPKLGLIWDMDEDIALFANVSRSYEPPTFSELVQFPVAGFVPLEAQRAWTAEVGSRGRLGTIAWDVTAYWSRIRGELLQFTTTPDIPAAIFNADRTRHRGIEAGLSTELWDGLTARASYTFSDFTFRNDDQFGNNRIAGLPGHVSHAEVRYRVPMDMELSASVSWAMSGTDADLANTLRTGSYAVFDLGAVWVHDDGWRIYGEARNIGGKRYVADISTVVDAATASNLNIFHPGEGRAFYAGLIREF